MAAPAPVDADALVVLRTTRGDTASVSPHGAQLLSWIPAGAGEQLYLSPLSPPAAGRSARGGAPVCFPQFADRGPLPKHGFVRTSRWELAAAPTTGEVVEARFRIDSGTASVAWEHAFGLVLAVRLGPGWIELHLEAENTGATAYAFTAALHTYLALEDVRSASLDGLQGCTYQDNLAGLQEKREAASALTFGEETDRVYLAAPASLRLQGGGGMPRRLVQQGFTDTVVWNPAAAKAARLGDMPPQDWLRMLCVEAAVIARPVKLAPGERWRGMQRLELPGLPGFDAAQATPVAPA